MKGEHNMIDIGDIYRNKLVPESDYYFKLVEVRTENTGQGRPLMQVILSPANTYGVLSKLKFSVIIHPTPSADCIYEAFRESFAIGEDGQVGRKFARIRIKHTRYGTTDYSKVIFEKQRQRDIVASLQLDRIEKREEAARAIENMKKAEIAVKKLAEKKAYEAKHGKRGRGRPRLGNGIGDEELQFE
jgi:hypothetical protein